jgi:hypothetical protein
MGSGFPAAAAAVSQPTRIRRAGDEFPKRSTQMRAEGDTSRLK